MRRLELKKGTLTLTDKQIEGFLDRTVTKLGTSAKVDCPRRYLGRHAYLIITKN
jgi:putative transposon-encoded protein